MQVKAVRKITGFLIAATMLLLSIRYILVTFQWREIYSILRRVEPVWLLGGGGLTILIYWLLRSIRWNIMLRRLQVPVHIGDLYLCTAISLSLAIFTPLQSGEALKVELLKRTGGLQRSEGYSSFALERYLDLCTVVLLAVVSFSERLTTGGGRTFYFYLLFGLAVLVVGLIGACKWEIKGRFRQPQLHIRSCVSDPGTIFLVVSLTFAGWCVIALGWLACLRSLAVEIGMQDALGLVSVITIVNILSFIPGAVGVSEAGIAEFLIRLGKDPASAQAGALIVRCYGLLMILIGLGHLGIWRLLRTSKGRDSGEIGTTG